MSLTTNGKDFKDSLSFSPFEYEQTLPEETNNTHFIYQQKYKRNLNRQKHI